MAYDGGRNERRPGKRGVGGLVRPGPGKNAFSPRPSADRRHPASLERQRAAGRSYLPEVDAARTTARGGRGHDLHPEPTRLPPRDWHTLSRFHGFTAFS